VRFDADDAAQPLRIWDHVEGDLVERDSAERDFARCDALESYWCVGTGRHGERTLRLAHDAAGTDLYPTWQEALEREAEGSRHETEARLRETEARLRETEARLRETEARQRETEARQRAERRVCELEAELSKRNAR
jgi:hypothetical protein